MRTITTTVYLFDELPTEQAKETARDWWRSCEDADPSWADEYADTRKAALAFVRSYNNADTLDGLFTAAKALRADPADSCPWTGFRADELAIDAILDAESWAGDQIADVIRAVEHALDEAWESEREYLHSPEQVDETIRANEYEFYKNGDPA